MKKWLLVASCLALNLPVLADAQPDQGPADRHGGQGGGRPEQAAKPAHGRPGQGGPGGAGPNRPGNGGPGMGSGGRPGFGGPNRPGNGHNRPNPGIPNRPNPGGPNRPGIPSRPTNPPRPSRPNWGWNGQRFRGNAYRYPAGWRYRRWAGGQFLPLLFLSPLYYFNDWVTLGIAPPPPGYRWVRFGPDLLLVRIGTGYIAYVIHNVFY